MDVITHRQLVEIAHKWVLKNASCGVAFKELVCSCSNEIPDVIGFGSWDHSVLVECKVSRSDFLSDKNKSFRLNPETGMGTQRFYCCPTGLIKIQDLPDGWGLLYVSDKGKCQRVHEVLLPNPKFPNSKIAFKHERNILAERSIMYSALRRLHLRGRIEEIYNPEITAPTDERSVATVAQ